MKYPPLISIPKNINAPYCVFMKLPTAVPSEGTIDRDAIVGSSDPVVAFPTTENGAPSRILAAGPGNNTMRPTIFKCPNCSYYNQDKGC